MTEAGEKWLKEKVSLFSYDGTRLLTFRRPDDVLRAFCEEVEKRAAQLALANSHGIPHDPNFVDYSDAFDELKRELLGDNARETVAKAFANDPNLRRNYVDSVAMLLDNRPGPVTSWNMNKVANEIIHLIFES